MTLPASERRTGSAQTAAVTRRRVLRTSAHAAWAAPVIVAAAAAPARAMGSTQPRVRATGVTSSRSGDFLTVNVPVTNETAADTTALLLAVRFTDSTTAFAAQTDPPTSIGGGFAFAGIDSVEGVASDRTYNFTKVAPQLTGIDEPATATATLTFTVRVYPLAASLVYLGEIVATPDPTPGTGIPSPPHTYT